MSTSHGQTALLHYPASLRLDTQSCMITVDMHHRWPTYFLGTLLGTAADHLANLDVWTI